MAKSKSIAESGSTATESISFESALELLEEITEQLESGEQGLDDSLRLYTEGIELARRCSQQLGLAEQKVAKLLAADGTFTPFTEIDSKSTSGD